MGKLTLRYITTAKLLAAALFGATLLTGIHAQAADTATSTSETKTRLILLGTAGGPLPKVNRSAPANVLVVNGKAYVIDAGDSVARQLIKAGVSPTSLRAVFIMHHHSDHNADYGNLLFLSWAAGLKNAVDTYGPPPLVKMTSLFLEMNDWDIQLRQREEHRPELAQLIKAHNIQGDGVVYQDENVKVTAFEVEHYGAKPSYGFRFDTPDRVIVFSGDTQRTANFIQMARNADILVHEVVNDEAVDRLVQRIDPGNMGLKDHIVNAHTPITEVGKIAAEAGVKTLVLTHFVPSDGPDDKDEIWPKDVRKDFKGPVVLGRDLMEVK